VHSGCVVFNIHVSHGLYFIEVPVCAKRTIQTGKSVSLQTSYIFTVSKLTSS